MGRRTTCLSARQFGLPLSSALYPLIFKLSIGNFVGFKNDYFRRAVLSGAKRNQTFSFGIPNAAMRHLILVLLGFRLRSARTKNGYDVDLNFACRDGHQPPVLFYTILTGGFAMTYLNFLCYRIYDGQGAEVGGEDCFESSLNCAESH